MNDKFLRNYAEVLVKKGVNMQKGQEVVVSCDVENAYFARIVCDVAYECGASFVTIRWEDEIITRSKFLNCAEDKLIEIPAWYKDFYSYYDNKKACYINIISDDPDLLNGIPSSRVRAFTHARNKALKEHSKNIMFNFVSWTIASVPSKKWAEKVYPGLNENEAIEKLWEAIAKACYADGDNPVEDWQKHVDTFTEKMDALNRHSFKYLKFKNSLGTDVTIELPKDHVWAGGSELNRDGTVFSANIPTEEIFSAPVNTGTNGRVVASMPLVYKGTVIEGIDLTFENGIVVRFSAKTNEETLKGILETDYGAKMLGEVALVGYTTPISQMKTLFYETLFDENASCHFALGKGYPCLKNYEKLSDEDIIKAGINDSLTHVDFMIGTSDLSIKGIKENGEEIDVFVNGDFAIK